MNSRKMMLPVIAGMAVLFASCASSRGVQVGSSAVDRALPVQVQNDNTSDVDVYVMSGGQVNRLGTVTALSSDTLKIPATAVTRGTNLRLLADPIGATGAYLSDPILVSSGDVLVFRVASQLALSTVTTR